MGSHLSVGQRVSSIKRAFALSYGTWKLVCFSTLEKTSWRFSAQKGIIALLFDYDVDSDKIHTAFWLGIRRSGAAVLLFWLDRLAIRIELFAFKEIKGTQPIQQHESTTAGFPKWQLSVVLEQYPFSTTKHRMGESNAEYRRYVEPFGVILLKQALAFYTFDPCLINSWAAAASDQRSGVNSLPACSL
jgi:hypothetical protein